MSFSLASCVGTAARLLGLCGPLSPLRLCLGARDLQVEVCGGGPAARAALARLAAAAGTVKSGLPQGVLTASSLTADLGEGLVLVAGLDETVTRVGSAGRATSTEATVTLLRTLGAWVDGLGPEVGPGAQLWVEDRGTAFTVRMLATAAQGEDLEAVASAVGRGLDGLKTRRTASGLDGTGRLPSGRTVQLGVVRLR